MYTWAIVGLLLVPQASAQQEPLSQPSAPAQLTLPPNFPPPAGRPPQGHPPPLCDLRASPDYVPGVDARGREVVPADIPSGREVGINTEVFVETRSRTPRSRGTGVIVNLPDLGAPACVPVEDKPPAP